MSDDEGVGGGGGGGIPEYATIDDPGSSAAATAGGLSSGAPTVPARGGIKARKARKPSVYAGFDDDSAAPIAQTQAVLTLTRGSAMGGDDSGGDSVGDEMNI